MSKRSRVSIRRANRKQPAKLRKGVNWPRYWPYFIVAVVAAGLIGALFLISGGGNSEGGDASLAYPVGYQPPVQGSADAPVEMVMWEDFQCPFCRRFSLNTIRELRSQYVDTGKMKLVWRNFQRYGQESTDAGVAAYCAGEQGKFWEYHDSLFAHQRGIQVGSFTKASLRQFAGDLRIDVNAFDACVVTNVDKYRQVLRSDFDAARSQDVSGTPTFFINGQLVVGAQPTETFVSVIEAKLRQAGQPEE